MTLESGRYLLRTLGCKANLYDTQLLEGELRARGWTPARGEAPADLCIVNSCTVTDEADRQSRKLAARLAKENPGAKIVMTGCGAEVDPEAMARAPGVTFVVGNQDKHRLLDLVAGEDPGSAGVLGAVTGYSALQSRHPLDREWPTPASSFMTPPATHEAGADEAGRTRAFLKIQEGCNSFCTFCIIPYGRGPGRSLGLEATIAQVSALVAEGVREVVITGTNIGDYGADLGRTPGVAELFAELLARTSLERLRVSSLDPTEITPALIALMEREPRFCPHFHVSLQSPHGRILRLMKRGYGWEEVRESLARIARIKAPPGGVFVGMDVITGFPGETDEDFAWTREALAGLPWSRLHVFPYSERAGTPATRLPGAVAPGERHRRAAVLRELSLERLTRHHREVLESARAREAPLEAILCERPTRGPDGTLRWNAGYTPNYLRVLIPSGELRNQLVRAMPYEILTDRATGDVAFLAELANPR